MGGFFDQLFLGCQVAFSAMNLLVCFAGVSIGTLIGVLPGIGPGGAISLLLPITFGMPPASAIILLAGRYYGAQYGGSTTSILVNIPGEASSVVTCLDGYQMALQGRAGPALGIAAFGSFIAGTLGVIMLMFLAVPLSEVVVNFGPPEFFSIIILALSILIYLARGSLMKAGVMAILGIILSQIGIDLVSGKDRFTFGIMYLLDGISLIPLVMGIFGIGEVLNNLNSPESREIYKTKIKGLLPTLADWKASIGPIIRGTFLGFFLGILPGSGAAIPTFISYTMEKRLSKHPEKFGRGAIEGVAGPESANNAGSTGTFVPLFTLGIPSNSVMAMLLGALMIHGLQPGPFLIKSNPEIFWGTIVSMYLGNIMLLILNLPLIGVWVKLLKVPYQILSPLILFFCVIGSYTIRNSVGDVIIMFIFGIIGFVFIKYQYEPAPLVMAFVLGDLLETSLRQSLLMSGGSFVIFITRPFSAACLLVTLLLLSANLLSRRHRETISKLA